ncbi:MAG: sulfotransferase domain-containing protein [Porticoccaceae bacterium]|nr:sulfotransferase domain-containing protein [Porticoccaceae bacterium]
MKTPDFLVIGAQKSGTTTLFSLLRRHPQIYLPPQKEVQFFSNDNLYEKGMDWYCSENFGSLSAHEIAGEISPQYLLYEKVPKRIAKDLPNVKLIAILRHPLERSYSHYLMSRRRGQESRGFREAFEDSVRYFRDGKPILEAEAYYQNSNYAEALQKYIELFGGEKILILFQEQLDKSPIDVLYKIYSFLGVDAIYPDNIGVRLHQAGKVRYPWLNDVLGGKSYAKSFIKLLVPWRIRSAVRFWVEQKNITNFQFEPIDTQIFEDYNWIVAEQKEFLKENFYLEAPWEL